MEAKHLQFIALALVIVVSGCADIPGQTGESSEEEHVEGMGLEVERFSISDERLSPEQRAQITTVMKNYHTEPINITETSLKNTGSLEVEKIECVPEEIETAQQGVFPERECTWEITAPSEDRLGAFDTRSETVTLHLEYESNLKNVEPLTVDFMPLSDIDSTTVRTIDFSNGEVEATMQVENPTDIEQTRMVDFTLTPVGDGRVKDTHFDFDYEPTSVFQVDKHEGGADVCPDEDQPIVRDQSEFRCEIEVDGTQRVERNLFFTAHYKYIREPNLGITVVNQ